MQALGLMLALVGAVAADREESPEETAFRACNQAELVFTGKVARVIHGAVGYTDPPLFQDGLIFDGIEVLRGRDPGKVEFAYTVTQNTEPEFPPDTTWVVAAFRTGQDWVIRYIHAADDRQLAAARLAVSLPVGWRMEKNEVLSPWAVLKGKTWPSDAPSGKGPVCARTGRPALLAGDDVEIKSEQVLPEKRDHFHNPYGDGQFKITVTNRSDRIVTVPALLTDGKTTLWTDSLVVVWAGKAFVLPGAGKFTAAQSVQLKSKESVSTVVDVLPLQGVDWWRGGAPMSFQFCLGEKTTTNFFYYHSGYHDPLREAAVREWKAREAAP